MTCFDCSDYYLYSYAVCISVNTAVCVVPVNFTIEWYLRSSPCYDEVFGLDVSVFLPKSAIFEFTEV